jgi:hypothetical protein
VEQLGSKYSGEVVSKFSAEGRLEASWGVNGQLDGSTAEKGPFEGKLEGVAVDPAGNLVVLDESDVFEFEQDGKPVGGTGDTYRLESAPTASGIAVNAADDVYAVDRDGAVQEYSPTGQALGSPVSGNYAPDPTGFGLDEGTGQVQVFVGLQHEQGREAGEALEKGEVGCAAGGACERFSSIGLQGVAGVAVEPVGGAVYAASTVPDRIDVFSLLLEAETAAASEVGATSMTVHGTVNPEGSPLENCYFEYGPTTNYGQSAPCEPDAGGIGSGTLPVPVSAKLEGLRGGTVYHFRVVAVKKEKGIPGNDRVAPATLPLPVITEPAVGELSAVGATLQASVDPEGVPVESCTFEYGTGTGYGTNVPCRPDVQHIGAGSEPITVKAVLEGLEPNVTYHWRLSVKDGNGSSATPDHVFVYPTVGNVLPDNRSYEMVSPPQKNGAAFDSLFAIHYGIAEDGSHVMLTSIQCYGGSRSCTVARGLEGEPVEFTRTSSGWAPTYIAPPASMFSANTYWLLAPEEATALFSMPSAPGGQDDWYARETDGSFTDIGPLTPPADGQTEFEQVSAHDVSAGFSHVVWEALGGSAHSQQWTSLGVAPATSEKQVYEYAGAGNSQPLLVGVNNEGRPLGCDVVLGNGQSFSRGSGVLSADGRTVYVTACGDLYARIDGGEPEAHTVTLDASACVEGLPGAAECKAVSAQSSPASFQGASTDGSKAFFLDTQKLTDEATQGTGDAARADCIEGSGNDCNLYLSECVNECETLHEQRRLLDVSAGDVSGFGPRVLGVIGSSADGSHVYFLANGVLAPGAAPGSCHGGNEKDVVALRCNLYLYERDARYPNGHIALVAVVPGADTIKLSGGDAPTSGVNVTPDGRFLVFESQGDLTPDDTRSDGATQIFRYDADPSAAEEAAHVPQLIRVSVGAEGYNDDGNAGVGNALIVSPEPEVVPYRGDPTMSNDGSRVFFQSPVALTPHALNDVSIGHIPTEFPENSGKFIDGPVIYAENVYEWEQPGAGSCPAGQAGGCTYLISDGRDVSDAKTPCEGEVPGVCLLGTDATGDNVFFSTADQLVPEDTDTAQDVYDAQVCSAEEPCAPHQAPAPEPCIGEQCHGIPEPTPSLLAPGTATFNGEGNITPEPTNIPPPAKKVVKRAAKCARGKHRSHGKCVKSSKKNSTKAKKSSRKKGK